MATLHELRSQIDQGKTAILFFKENGEIVKVSIRQQGGEYTRMLTYPEQSNLFSQQGRGRYSSWQHLLDDITDLEKTSDQWSIE